MIKNLEIEEVFDEDSRRWREHSCLGIDRMIIETGICGIDASDIKITATFFTDLETILKFVWKNRKP